MGVLCLICIFTYDSADWLIGVTGDVDATYEYNGDGDRYAQTVEGVRTDYVLDPVGLADVLVETTAGQNRFYLPGLAEYDTAWRYCMHAGPIGQRAPIGRSGRGRPAGPDL